MIILSILWVPIVSAQQGAQLYIYIQAISAYLAPPIASVYLLAILWKRCNEKVIEWPFRVCPTQPTPLRFQGAFVALVAGLIVGVIRMVLDFVYPEPPCGTPDNRPSVVSQVNYMYFAGGLFWITALTAVIVSLLTKPPDPAKVSFQCSLYVSQNIEPFLQLIRTTYWTRKDPTIRPDDQHEMAVVRDNQNQNGAAEDTLKAENASIPYAQSVPERQNALKRFAYKSKSLVCAGYSWFCGYDNTPASEATLREFESHLRQITTLEQTAWERRVLLVNTIIVLCVVVFVYVFFSVYTPVLASYYKPDVLKQVQAQ